MGKIDTTNWVDVKPDIPNSKIDTSSWNNVKENVVVKKAPILDYNSAPVDLNSIDTIPQVTEEQKQQAAADLLKGSLQNPNPIDEAERKNIQSTWGIPSLQYQEDKNSLPYKATDIIGKYIEGAALRTAAGVEKTKAGINKAFGTPTQTAEPLTGVANTVEGLMQTGFGLASLVSPHLIAFNAGVGAIKSIPDDVKANLVLHVPNESVEDKVKTFDKIIDLPFAATTTLAHTLFGRNPEEGSLEKSVYSIMDLFAPAILLGGGETKIKDSKSLLNIVDKFKNGEATEHDLKDYTDFSNQLQGITVNDIKQAAIEKGTPESMDIALKIDDLTLKPVTREEANKQYRDQSELQSKHAYDAVKAGPDAVEALKITIDNSKALGDITPEEHEKAMLKINSYEKYATETTDLGLNEDNERRVHDLTWSNENLKLQSDQLKTNPDAEIPGSITHIRLNQTENLLRDNSKEMEELMAPQIMDQQSSIALKSEEKAKTVDKKVQEKVKATDSTKPYGPEEGAWIADNYNKIKEKIPAGSFEDIFAEARKQYKELKETGKSVEEAKAEPKTVPAIAVENKVEEKTVPGVQEFPKLKKEKAKVEEPKGETIVEPKKEIKLSADEEKYVNDEIEKLKVDDGSDFNESLLPVYKEHFKNKYDEQKSNITPTEGESSTENSQVSTEPKAKRVISGTAKAKRKLSSKAIEALKIEANSPYDRALQYFVNRGQLHPSAIKELYGEKANGESRARIGLLNKSGKTISEIAHTLWENRPEGDERHTDQDYHNAVEQVINEHKSTSSMADELLRKADVTHEMSKEDSDYYDTQIAPEFIDEALNYWDGLTDAEKESLALESESNVEPDRNIDKEIIDAKADYTSKQSKYEKAKSKLDENGGQDQIDIFGNTPADETLFKNDIAEQEKMVSDLKKEATTAKEKLNSLEEEKKNIQPENQLRVDEEAERQSIADRLRKGKISGAMSSIDFGLSKTIINAALEFAAKHVEKGDKIGVAIEKAVKWIDDQMAGKKWNKKEFIKYATNKEEAKTVSPKTPEEYKRNIELSKNKSSELKAEVKESSKSFNDLISETFAPVSTVLNDIHPVFKKAIRDYQLSFETAIKKDVAEITPYLDAKRKMLKDKDSNEDWHNYNLALMNSDQPMIDSLRKKYDLEKEDAKRQVVFDEIHKDSTDVGIDLGYKKDYHPRVVKDIEGLMAYIKDEHPEDSDVIQSLIKLKELYLERAMTEAEKGALVSSLLIREKGSTSLAGIGNFKLRSIEHVTPDMMKYYFDADQAMLHYITGAREAIARRKLFGKADAETGTLTFGESLGLEAWKLIEKGDIDRKQFEKVQDVLTAYFNKGPANKFMVLLKNMTFIDILGNFKSAISNLSDVGLAIHEAGPLSALKHTLKSVINKSDIKMNEVLAEDITHEFANEIKVHGVMDALFTWSGFKHFDRMGKEVQINAIMDKLKSDANKYDGMSPHNKIQFKKRITDWIDDQHVDEVIKDLKEGKLTEQTLRLVYNRMLDLNPVGKSEMSEGYLKNPGGRWRYALHSYTLKRFDVYRNEITKKIKSDNPKVRWEGYKSLIKMATALSVAQAGVTTIQDLMGGKKVAMTDIVFNSMLQLLGTSPFMINIVKQQGTKGVVATEFAVPVIGQPFSILDDIYDDVFGKHKGKTVKHIPGIGVPIYDLLIKKQ